MDWTTFLTKKITLLHSSHPKCDGLKCGWLCVWHTASGGSHAHPTFRQEFAAWPLQCHMLPRCILAIVLHWRDLQGEEEEWGWGAQIRWWCLPWIYVSVSEPFMRRHLPLFFGGSHLFAAEAAVQILAVVVHLLPLWDLPPLLLFPTLHRYTLHLSNA